MKIVSPRTSQQPHDMKPGERDILFDQVVCRMDDGETLDQAIEAVTGGGQDAAALRSYAQGETDAIFASLDEASERAWARKGGE